MIVLIDNYDSFTFNIYQYIRELTREEVRVFRNDAITLEELIELRPKSLIISPGPGRPEDAGISLAGVKHFIGKIPILGVCLGHQTIVQALGGRIVGAKQIVHGKVEPIKHDGKGLFRNIPSPAEYTRYHSLVAEEESLPAELEITSRAGDGEIMGVRHKTFVVEGVQFHPESIGSKSGHRLIRNFLKYKRESLNNPKLLNSLLQREDLESYQTEAFMEELTDGNLSEAAIAATLVGLQSKGITPQELAGCARVLKRKKTPVKVSVETIDTCGTGGDGRGTFNISSFSALITAAMGVPVAKHGNRAVSSKSGSADFYRSLGIPVDSSAKEAAQMIEEEGFSFLFAPIFHEAMRHAAPVRQALGIKTIMNLLGPLVNPTESKYQLIGVYASSLCPVMARAARILGVRRVMVVHSEDGLDEISPTAKSRLFFIDEMGVEHDMEFDPASVGVRGYSLDDLDGGTGSENAAIAEDILALVRGGSLEDSLSGNQRSTRACIEACSLNAGAAAFVYGKAESVAQGYALAKEALLSGGVERLITKLRKINTGA